MEYIKSGGAVFCVLLEYLIAVKPGIFKIHLKGFNAAGKGA